MEKKDRALEQVLEFSFVEYVVDVRLVSVVVDALRDA